MSACVYQQNKSHDGHVTKLNQSHGVHLIFLYFHGDDRPRISRSWQWLDGEILMLVMHLNATLLSASAAHTASVFYDDMNRSLLQVCNCVS